MPPLQQAAKEIGRRKLFAGLSVGRDNDDVLTTVFL
jgi:hypothetical protein